MTPSSNGFSTTQPPEISDITSRMTVWVIRAFFLLVCAGTGAIIGFSDSFQPKDGNAYDPLLTIVGMIGLFFAVMILEMLLRAASDIAALVFGLFLGVILALLSYALVTLIPGNEDNPALRLVLIPIFCYLCVVLVFKTRHRFNFIIPYVEFQRQQKGPRAMLLDTSSIIDGRIADIAKTAVFDTPIIIPRFILRELQAVADSSDRLRKARGRRGMEVVNRLQHDTNVEIIIEEGEVPGNDTVDSKLVRLARSLGARIITNDVNLSKIAQIQDISVININDLANAVRPSFLHGEEMRIEIIKDGAEPGQGVGYLDDGTMVVAENGGGHVGETVALEVTRMLQTSTGKMVFGRIRN